MEIPEELHFTTDHEWVMISGNMATIGISDFAQQSLGDITFIELPEEGADVNKHEAFGVVESVKAVSDLYAPVSGKVVETNSPLTETPEVINEEPYTDGWMVRMEIEDPESQIADLMDAKAYRKHVEENS